MKHTGKCPCHCGREVPSGRYYATTQCAKRAYYRGLRMPNRFEKKARNAYKARMMMDVCAPSGSGIVDTLNACGVDALGIGDAFSDYLGDVPEWIVSNPPYRRGLVDKIIWRQIERLRNGEVRGVAMLMRWGFDFALTRKKMFAENLVYYGQIKTLFRPVWFEKQDGNKQPFHPYTWHVWKERNTTTPFVMYSDGGKPKWLQ